MTARTDIATVATVRYLLAILALSCGAPESQTEAPAPSAPHECRIGPWLSVTGERDAADEWRPTTLHVDARHDGWFLECMNHVTPSVRPGRNGGWNLSCEPAMSP